MTYLLDTDILIFMIRGFRAARRQADRRRAQTLMERCREAQSRGDSVGLSAVTVSELEFGARGSRSYEDEIAAVRKVLAPFEIHDYDSVVCPERYGLVRQAVEAAGTPIGAMDLLIAAHALALDATLLTNNTIHFSRVPGLRIANWLTRK